MNNEIKYIGKDDLTERELFLLSLIDTSINIPKVNYQVSILLVLLFGILKTIHKKYQT